MCWRWDEVVILDYPGRPCLIMWTQSWEPLPAAGSERSWELWGRVGGSGETAEEKAGEMRPEKDLTHCCWLWRQGMQVIFRSWERPFADSQQGNTLQSYNHTELSSANDLNDPGSRLPLPPQSLPCGSQRREISWVSWTNDPQNYEITHCVALGY